MPLRKNDSSVRSMLLKWLLVPLSTLAVISCSFAYLLAVCFANEAYDRQLINSADSVAGRLRYRDKRLIIDLPPAAQAILRHNNRDKFYYQILHTDGRRIIGDIIPGPYTDIDSPVPVFRYAIMNGERVRVARIRIELPKHPEGAVLVQAAETLHSRELLAHQILLSIVVPQLLLIALGAITVCIGVGRGLAPLKLVQEEVACRSRHDLSPLAEQDAPLEIRPLVKAINDLLSRLGKDIDSQRRFIANAAHQLRTPLAGLKTYVGFAQRKGQSKDVLDQLDKGIDRMTHLINRLLALAKVEPCAQLQERSDVDLNFIASEATSELVPKALERDIQLSFESADPAVLVHGDATSLKELAINLVENAVLYTQAGGEVTVRVSNGDGVKLSVEDNGPGIPDEERERVFERFYRILGTDATGSGLGLSIVKEIAQAHDADIFLGSGPNDRGTRVSVHFPVSRRG